jgi:hypothetical protein
MSSLRARLLAWLLGGVLAVGAIGGFSVYRNALSEADAFFDYHLRQTALVLRDEGSTCWCRACPLSRLTFRAVRSRRVLICP